MEKSSRPRKEQTEFNRSVFADNMKALTRDVLRLNPTAAAAKVGVDANWMKKMCSVGVARLDPRSKPQLQRVADFFRISIDDLWKFRLLHMIWMGRCSPEAKKKFISTFHFEQTLHADPEYRKEFETDIEELLEMETRARGGGDPPEGVPVSPPKNGGEARPPSMSDDEVAEFLDRAEKSQDPVFVETARRLVEVARSATEETVPTLAEMLDTLVTTGRYDYLTQLIHDLYTTERMTATR